MEQPQIFIMEYESESVKPERRLWAAVVVTALEEYEDWCRSAEKHWRMWNSPVPIAYYHELQDMRRHCMHRWFGVVCALADVEQEWVIARFDSIAKEYCINSLPFDHGGELLTEWQQRRLTKPKRRSIN